MSDWETRKAYRAFSMLVTEPSKYKHWIVVPDFELVTFIRKDTTGWHVYARGIRRHGYMFETALYVFETPEEWLRRELDRVLMEYAQKIDNLGHFQR